MSENQPPDPEQQPPREPQPYPPQPPQYGQQQPYPQQPAYYPPQPPPKKSNTWKWVLGSIGLVLVLFCGGCLAVTGAFFNEVDDAIEESEQEDQEPGHVDNPLEIEVGEAFEVDGMEYAAGWTIGKDFVGDVEIKKLKVTNHRGEADEIIIEIKLWKGNEILAQADCSTEEIDEGVQVTPDCFSADKLPKSYDKVTVNDTF